MLDDPGHMGVQSLVRDINHLYRSRAALHQRDDDPGGFSWVEVNDRANSVFGFMRHGHTLQAQMLVACNFTLVPRPGYRLGVPQGGFWHECLNTDSTRYGGSSTDDSGSVMAEALPAHGHAYSVCLDLPPLSVLWLEPEPVRAH